jgi:Ni,Fe-hydrogenase III small subunit
MFTFYTKIFSTGRMAIHQDSLSCDEEVEVVGKKIDQKIIKLFQGSLAIRAVDTGSDNACEQELTALSNPYYDVERFGIHFVASPRHADMLMVTGAVSRNMREALVKTYEATPEPKMVDGGIFRGSYGVLDGVDKVIPVDFSIPGDPPSPAAILCHLLKILEVIDMKKRDSARI